MDKSVIVLKMVLLTCSCYEVFLKWVITLDWTLFDVDVVLQVGLVSWCMVLGHVDVWLFHSLIRWVLNIECDLV
jgi:hypothetical protein